MVLILVSEHCYIPIFVIRPYDDIIRWTVLQIITTSILAFGIINKSILANIAFITMMVKILIWCWFLWMECHIKQNIVREQLPYEQRQPRNV